MKAHIGADVDAGLVHTVQGTHLQSLVHAGLRQHLGNPVYVTAVVIP